MTFIPKKLILLAPDKDSLHHKILDNIEYLKEKNTNWKIQLFDDEDIRSFIKLEYDEFYLDIFDCINGELGPAKADFFRYLYIFKKGGVYLDLKSTINIKLDQLLLEDDKFVISNWGGSHRNWGFHKELGRIKELQQWFIISSPNNYTLKSIIDRCILNLIFYNKAVYGVGKSGVVKTTGPIPFSQEIIRDPPKSCRKISSEEAGLVYSIFGTGFTEHAIAFKNHYIHSSKEVVSSNKIINKEKYKTQIQDLIKINDQKINNSRSKIKKYKLHEYSIEQLRTELELNPTDFFVLSVLSKKLVAAKMIKDAIDVLKLQLILRPYCRQSYELIFKARDLINK